MTCDYTGHHFGARYPDAVCIDGYLWDLDSCDEPGGPLHSGGDIPCPQCSLDGWVAYVADDVRNEGAMAHYKGVPIDEVPKFRFAQERLAAFWREGWREDAKEDGPEDPPGKCGGQVP